MAYPSPTTINATQGIPVFLNYVNNVTNQWFANSIMIAIFVIILMGYYKAKDDFVGAFAVSGFATFVVGLLFWLGGFVNGWAFSISVAMLFVGVIILLVDSKN